MKYLVSYKEKEKKKYNNIIKLISSTNQENMALGQALVESLSSKETIEIESILDDMLEDIYKTGYNNNSHSVKLKTKTDEYMYHISSARKCNTLTIIGKMDSILEFSYMYYINNNIRTTVYNRDISKEEFDVLYSISSKVNIYKCEYEFKYINNKVKIYH